MSCDVFCYKKAADKMRWKTFRIRIIFCIYYSVGIEMNLRSVFFHENFYIILDFAVWLCVRGISMELSSCFRFLRQIFTDFCFILVFCSRSFPFFDDPIGNLEIHPSNVMELIPVRTSVFHRFCFIHEKLVRSIEKSKKKTLKQDRGWLKALMDF